MYAEGPFYIIHGSIIDGLVRSGLTVRMGGPNEGRPLTQPSPFASPPTSTAPAPCAHHVQLCQTKACNTLRFMSDLEMSCEVTSKMTSPVRGWVLILYHQGLDPIAD